MSSRLVQALSQTRVFLGVDPALLASLGAAAMPVRVRAEQHLFHTGDDAETFFWLESGSMRLYRLTHDGEEKVFQMVGDGDLVAETAMFIEPCRYPLSAVAESECILHRLPRRHLLALVRQSPDIALRFLAAMSQRLYQAVNRIDQLTVNNASQRLVLYFIDLHRQQRSRWLTLPVNINVLARQLNIVPETLSRQLHRFKQAGLISGQRREWVLLDVEGLCRAVDLPVSSCTDDISSGSAFACCNFR
jgi:CRP-like cAMP-binding protein